jgi:hypothetical protein
VVTVLVDGALIARYKVSGAAGDPVDPLWRVVNLQIAPDGTPTPTQVQTLHAGQADAADTARMTF